MKVLVSAASKYGATSEIAQATANVLAEKGLEVTVIPPAQAGPIEQFDAVVLGSAVYMGRWMKPGRELAQRQAAALAARPIASATRVQEGDFRNWDNIRAWATSIADTLLA
jgi:menaquinone-dependent protoporphyrinogen oxidase